jgi:hypothetical protein
MGFLGYVWVMDGHDEYFVLVFLFVCRYSPEQVYAVVAAVDMYEDFVPWCQSSRVLWCKEDEALDAELKVGFKLFLERYISHVELKRPHLIRVRFCCLYLLQQKHAILFNQNPCSSVGWCTPLIQALSFTWLDVYKFVPSLHWQILLCVCKQSLNGMGMELSKER